MFIIISSMKKVLSIITLSVLIIGLFGSCSKIRGDVEQEGGNNPAEKSFVTDPPEHLKNWMGDLPDDVYIRDLSIPGSHDAFSYRCIDDAKDQTLNAGEQFDWGIRWFDIRYYWEEFGGGQVYPCHMTYGSTDKSLSILDDLRLLEERIKNNPTEGAIIRLRGESDMGMGSEEAKKSVKWLKDKALSNEMYIPVREDLILSEIRGKIVVMSDDSSWDDSPYDFDFDYTQDDYSFNDKVAGEAHKDLSYITKKASAFSELVDVRRGIDRWCPGVKYNDWTINHCSGFLNTFRPVEFAGNVTPEILKVLQNVAANKTLGVVPMDFIGCTEVYESSLSAKEDRITPQWYTISTTDIIKRVVDSNNCFKEQ